MPQSSADKQILRVLQGNLQLVQQRIESACERAGRDPKQIHLVAVTKYAEWNWVQQLAKLHSQFGENRPQQLIDRQQQLPDIQWHLIGQLQRNKARSVLPRCGLIHSVDSQKLFQKLANVGHEVNIHPQVLLQVNVSGEDSKSGFTPSEVTDAWQDLVARGHQIDVRGFMTMAPANQDSNEARKTFRGLRELRDSIVNDGRSLPATWSLGDLSMGMSGDFGIAIEEGATIVRVGSALFAGLETSE
ncbi:UNVERIFIED_CONTAM: hypothetical protein GTU68_027762 [Idotea baltica]|nr:hypothetical protein [Idotea baltica]